MTVGAVNIIVNRNEKARERRRLQMNKRNLISRDARKHGNKVTIKALKKLKEWDIY